MAQDLDYFREPPPQPSGAGTALKLVAILGGIAVLCFALCCGAGVLFVNFGMSVVSADIERQLRDHPQIRESIGEIEDLGVNWRHSLAHEDDDTFVYDIEGSKSNGQITVESISHDDGSEEIVWAELRLPDGEVLELSLE